MDCSLEEFREILLFESPGKSRVEFLEQPQKELPVLSQKIPEGIQVTRVGGTHERILEEYWKEFLEKSRKHFLDEFLVKSQEDLLEESQETQQGIPGGFPKRTPG